MHWNTLQLVLLMSWELIHLFKSSMATEICFKNDCDDLCILWKIDAVLTFKNGTKFVFRGKHFWIIDQPNILSSRLTISDYWNITIGNTSVPFKGYIDGATRDDHGNFYFYKDSKILWFKKMNLNQKMTLKNIGKFPQKYNSVVYIKRPIDSKEILYIFKDGEFAETHSNITQTDDVYFKDVDVIHKKFPRQFDAIYQEKKDSIMIISGPQYLKIPLSFPTNIDDDDLVPQFVYKDIYHCTDKFYKRTQFVNYDEFIIELVKKGLSLNQPIKQTAKARNFNFKYLIVGVILLVVVILVIYLSVEYMKSRRTREFNAAFRISDSLMQRYHDVKA